MVAEIFHKTVAQNPYSAVYCKSYLSLCKITWSKSGTICHVRQRRRSYYCFSAEIRADFCFVSAEALWRKKAILQ